MPAAHRLQHSGSSTAAAAQRQQHGASVGGAVGIDRQRAVGVWLLAGGQDACITCRLTGMAGWRRSSCIGHAGDWGLAWMGKQGEQGAA